MAIEHLTLKASGAISKGTELMLPPSMMIDWARCLLAYEAVAGTTSMQPQAATLLVYEKLRNQLSPAMGVAGFRAFASRALMMAKSDSPGISALLIAADGSLQGLGEVKPQKDPDHGGESGLNFIAQLLGLFLTFLGPETTRQLVQDVFPYLVVEKEAESAAVPDTFIPFDEIEAEVEPLRQVSERLETLADKHPAVEDALMIVSGNIRNLATILDVLVVIRSNPGGLSEGELDLPEDAPDQSMTGYVN